MVAEKWSFLYSRRNAKRARFWIWYYISPALVFTISSLGKSGLFAVDLFTFLAVNICFEFFVTIEGKIFKRLLKSEVDWFAEKGEVKMVEEGIYWIAHSDLRCWEKSGQKGRVGHLSYWSSYAKRVRSALWAI